MDSAPNPLRSDLDAIVSSMGELWEGLRGARVFVTGGTGFVGCWMLESLLHANAELGLDAKAVVLTRDPARFARKAPHLSNDHAVSLVTGDLRDFRAPSGTFTHVLHLATETNSDLSAPRPSQLFDASVDGTRRVLEFAAASGVEQLLFTSSGAVYGSQPSDCARLSEDLGIAPAPENLDAAYGHGKRAAEFLCCAAHAEHGLAAKIARCFAFVGPYLPLRSGYAVGNFIDDALAKRAIRVSSDGSAVRSYLYAADLAAWLWAVLLRGEPARPYNVGSDRPISIAELARTVSRVLGPVEVTIEGTTGDATRSRYVPDTERARIELGVRESVTLEEAIERTARWHRATPGKVAL
jgi:dTDP-glucose 4,6-dehydratase